MVTTMNSSEQIETLEDVLELFDQAAEHLRMLHNPRIEAYCLATLEGSRCGWLGRFARDELEDVPYCFWHNPETAQEAAEARRLGGLRRRREGTIAGAFDFEGIGSVPQIQRIVEIAISDTLGLENSIARNRTLGSLAQGALKALEVGELEARLEALEAVFEPRSAGRRAR
jgi:hypothetical protein